MTMQSKRLKSKIALRLNIILDCTLVLQCYISLYTKCEYNFMPLLCDKENNKKDQILDTLTGKCLKYTPRCLGPTYNPSVEHIKVVSRQRTSP